MTTSTIMNSPSLERRARRNNGKPVHDIDSQEVEKDREHVDKEQQQPARKPKKSRVIWTEELHKKFMAAYDQLLSKGGNDANHCPTLCLNIGLVSNVLDLSKWITKFQSYPLIVYIYAK
jgi:uncharacterized membrane protein